MFRKAIDIRNCTLALIGVGLLLSAPLPQASAYTPEDPVVQQMVSRGIKFIEGFDPKGVVKRGEHVLLAYTHYKVEHDTESPVFKRGLASALEIAKEAAAGIHVHDSNYDVSVSVMLLATVDPQAYKPQLEAMQRYLFSEQRPHGGFTYHGEDLGDISQTQYVMLAIWTLDRAGIRLDYQRVASALKWLLRVQDAEGGWNYHATDPGPGKPLIRQSKVTHSMALAGGSSVLIAGDAIRLWGDTSDNDDPGIVGLPKAVRLFKEDVNVDRRKRATMSKEPIFRSMGLLNAWRQKTPYKRTALDWYYYQLYTLERFESFIEIAKGAAQDKSPAWYNEGVNDLRKYQGSDGGWSDRSRTRPYASTALAILFLIRSTQKTIFTSAGGGTIGGQGFGENIANAKLVRGKAETKAAAQAVTDMLDLLEKDGADDLADQSLPENLQLSDDPEERASQLDRLERLVRGSKSWQARRVAARVLGKSDEMRVVPALIFALSDGDSSVKRYARDGLRFISRKFDGFGMPNKPNYAQLRDAQNKWRQWYLTMEPEYVFLDP